MTLRVRELDLLIEIYKYLDAEGSRKDLAVALLRVIDRLSDEREREYMQRLVERKVAQ